MVAVLLALVTAVTYGVANYLGPLLARRVPLATVLLVGQLAALGTGTFAFGEAFRRGLLAVVSVIATLNPVVTVGLALLLLRERFRRAQQAGVVVALAGVVMLAAAEAPTASAMCRCPPSRHRTVCRLTPRQRLQ